MVCDTPYLQNEFGDPRFFSRFLPNFVIFYLQSFKKICTWELLGANVLKNSNALYKKMGYPVELKGRKTI